MDGPGGSVCKVAYSKISKIGGLISEIFISFRSFRRSLARYAKDDWVRNYVRTCGLARFLAGFANSQYAYAFSRRSRGLEYLGINSNFSGRPVGQGITELAQQTKSWKHRN